MSAQEYEDRRNLVPWRKLYFTARWRKLRAEQLRREPNCRTCARLGRLTPATVCDHCRRHRGDPTLFWAGPFQSLCATHHSSDKQALERGRPRAAFDADGWPAG